MRRWAGTDASEVVSQPDSGADHRVGLSIQRFAGDAEIDQGAGRNGFPGAEGGPLEDARSGAEGRSRGRVSKMWDPARTAQPDRPVKDPQGDLADPRQLARAACQDEAGTQLDGGT